jgi:hypothetical protein
MDMFSRFLLPLSFRRGGWGVRWILKDRGLGGEVDIEGEGIKRVSFYRLVELFF